MKNMEGDKLKDIFGKMKVESPSMSFEAKLMVRVRAEHKLLEKKRSKLSLLSIVVGTLVLITLPIATFTFFGYSLSDISYSWDSDIVSSLASVKADHLTISIAIISLVLLMGDTLIRKHLQKKEKN